MVALTPDALCDAPRRRAASVDRAFPQALIVSKSPAATASGTGFDISPPLQPHRSSCDEAEASRHLVADHPRPCRWKPARAARGGQARPCGFPRAARAARGMGRPMLVQRSRGVGAAFVDRDGLAAVGGHSGQTRRDQKRPGCGGAADRAILRIAVFRHRTQLAERAAAWAKVIIDWHLSPPIYPVKAAHPHRR